jgi:carboxymethylenebutenolidase
MLDPKNLTPAQQTLAAMWDQHTGAEFQDHDLEATLSTMVDDPAVNHVPILTGGSGAAEIRDFYSTYFIPCQPPDTEIVFHSRTIGENRLIDELVHKFTHTIPMPWLLPGVPPTGRRVELAVVVVVEFEKGKIARERIYWDNASLLVQVGVLDPAGLPVYGVEVTRKLSDSAMPNNALIKRAEAEGHQRSQS